MARIRIVDEWLRSPVTAPVRARAVMVVADTWAEQKVLMRAFASCRDQSRPSIILGGHALAMGPASTDPHGPWGVHVDDQRDGRAQQLREQLELAAQRLHGTNKPPRLIDEESSFERKATNQWSPGAPRDRRSQAPLRNTPAEPMDANATRHLRPARPALAPSPAPAPAAPARPASPPQFVPANPDARTVMPFRQDQWLGSPPPASGADAPRRAKRETPIGWAAPGPSAPVSQPGFHRAHTPIPTDDSLGKIVGRTMPIGFSLEGPERKVLNRLGKQGRLAAREVGEIAEADDAVAWMEQLMSKLADHGLDIIEPGDDLDGEPTYVLRH